MYYLLAFLPLFPVPLGVRQKVFLCPQFAFSRTQVTNDNETVKSKKVPDFCLVYIEGHVSPEPPITSAAQVTNHAFLHAFLRGPWVANEGVVLALCEIKSFPKFRGDIIPSALPRYLKTSMSRKFSEAKVAARIQLKIFFDSHPLAIGVVAIACVGDFFAWVSCERDMVSPPSKHFDSTFRPSTGFPSKASGSYMGASINHNVEKLSAASAVGSIRGGRSVTRHHT